MKMESEERSSTASTVSGVYQNILKSPAPICMFYFSHPFGITSPIEGKSGKLSATPQDLGGERQKNPTRKGQRIGIDQVRKTTLTPWPRDTWRREFYLPPLVQLIARQNGRKVPDIEGVLRTIRRAWNTPSEGRRSICSGFRDETSSASDWDLVSTVLPCCEYRHHYNMGSGTFASTNGGGLLRRRYSVPEIIMRKHSLSQQRSMETKEETSVASMAPTPRHSPLMMMRSPAEMGGPGRRGGGGSDSNLSRATPTTASSDMRKSTLLRRIWGKDPRRGVYMDSRSGSWSPPLRRSQRRLHYDAHPCAECQKLNGGTHNSSGSSSSGSQSSVFLASGRTPSLASPKRLKLMSNGGICSRRAMDSENTNLAGDSPTTTVEDSVSPQVTNGDGGKNVNIYMSSVGTPTSQENNNLTEESLRIEIETTTLTSAATGDENMNEPPTTTVTVTRTERVNKHHSDEEMDRYISKLLIDSLNNVIDSSTGNELITSEDTNGNDATRESLTADENLNNIEDVVYSAISTADMSDPALDVSDTVSTTPPDAGAVSSEALIRESRKEKVHQPPEEVPIYFPRYSAESKGDLSSYTSMCSEPDPQEIAAVGTGSSYPDVDSNGEPLLIPRLSAFPRTESMEVQPSSASACEDGENGDNLPDDEDSDSLVDSLDDPESPEHKFHSTESLKAPSSAETAKSPQIREKGEAFFVPMSETQIPVDEHIVVADTMPEKLRDKLVRRQKRRDMKKEQEIRRRQKMQKYIDQKLEERLEELQVNGNRNSRAIIAKKDIPATSVSTNGAKGAKKNVLRTEIGMLESYTIDSRGNMQFNPPPKEAPKAPKTIKRTNFTRKITKSKSEEHPVPEKKFQVKKSSSDTLPRRGKGVRKDVQHMTLYQTADLTPDTEGGPRRMYQKTEIQDGEKRIEILEIVECLDTSPETSPGMRNPMTYRVGAKSCRRSRIPVPIYKSARKSGQRSSHNGMASPRTMANAKVDKLIADLLIEALNNPVDIGIEFVPSPKIEKAVNGKKNGVKKRSANSGIKYHQVFDVIPEERSSFSFDSSNEESGSHKTRIDSGHGASTKTTTKDTIQSTMSEKSGLVAKSSSVENSEIPEKKSADSRTPRSKPEMSEKTPITNRGRAALESETWLGFFKPHEESSAEEESSSRTHHHFCPHHPCHQFTLTPSSDTLTTVSSVLHHPTMSLSSTVDFYSPDTFTNTIPSSQDEITANFLSCSSGSDNILTVIEKVEDRSLEPVDSISDPTKSSAPSSTLPAQINQADKMEKTPRMTEENKPSTESKSEIDSNSFVIIPASEATSATLPSTNELPEPESAKSTKSSAKARDVCKDCCFCNPDLHKKTDDTSRSCHFCDKKRHLSDRKKAEDADPPQSGYETAKSHHYYEVLSKSDHQHTKTKSKDPDTVSTRCVKTNEKIQRFIPSPEETKKGKITRPKDTPVTISRGSAVHRVIQDDVDTSRKAHKTENGERKQKIQFPSPYRMLSSPQSYDDGSSCSEDADFSPPVAPRLNPTMRSRWANSSRHSNYRRATNGRSNASSSHPKSSFASTTTTNTSNTATPGTNTGWSVTVAGNYHPQLAPDVEMRLSFPKAQTETILPMPPPSATTTNRDFYESTPPPPGTSNDPSRPRAALPPTHTPLNPKRTLTKVTPAPSANGRNYRFPEVNTTQALSRQTAKKAIKRVECSVAVTSATRTISKFSRAQRAMSFQSLHHPAIEDVSYRNRSRDGSVGNLSSRRLSLDGSHSDDVASLSIMGNAIAPELKPRVPTMSEKDLTRRHSSCFTRNRSYLT
ncbi:hypothetical protein DMENIID0001_130490 [Sergentomyia squamirostris]